MRTLLAALVAVVALVSVAAAAAATLTFTGTATGSHSFARGFSSSGGTVTVTADFDVANATFQSYSLYLEDAANFRATVCSDYSYGVAGHVTLSCSADVPAGSYDVWFFPSKKGKATEFTITVDGPVS